MLSSMKATSSAVRASGPCTWPGSQASGIGWFGVRPGVGRMPTMPQNAAGIRMEQPKSVPCASGTMPVATATAEPPDEPAGLSAGFHGLRVGPNSALLVLAPQANSGVLVFASTMAPDALRRRTTSASSSGTWSLNNGDAKVVRMPAVGVMSLIATGKPCRAPSGSPFTTAASAARAASRARSAASVTIALSFELIRSITAKWASSTSTGLTSPLRIRRASSRADLRVRLTSIMLSLCSLEHNLFRKPESTFRDHALFAGPVDEAPLDQQEQQVEPVAERAGGEDGGVHVGHREQLLR